MKLKLLGIIALLALAPAGLSADSTTLQAGGTFKNSRSEKCNNQACIEQEKLSLQYMHTFVITPEMAASVVENTEFRLQSEWGEVSANVSDDPAFFNGKRSAQVTSIQSISGFPVKVYMKLDWDNTYMRIIAVGSFKDSDVFAPNKQADKTSGDKGPPSTFTLLSRVSPPLAPEIVANASLKVLFTEGGLESANEAGEEKELEFFSVKSFGFEQGEP